MSESDIYNPVIYSPPSIVRHVGSALSIPLGESNFLDIFSGDRDEQLLYVHRLLSLSYFFIGVVVVWFLVILVLKCKNPECGCASGASFDTRKPIYEGDLQPYEVEDAPEREEPSSSSYNSRNSRESVHKKNSRETEATALYSLPSKRYQSSQRKLGEDGAQRTDSGELSDESQDVSYRSGGSSDMNAFNPSPQSDHFADETAMRQASQRRMNEILRSAEDEFETMVLKRASLTRAVFLFFGTLVLSCGVAAAVSAYRPFVDATTTAQEVIQTIFTLTKRSDDIATKVSDSVLRASNSVDEIPSVYSSLCPGIPENTLINEVGINPIQIINDARKEVKGLETEINAGVAELRGVLVDIDSVLDTADETSNVIDDYLWIIPFLILATIILTVFLLGGTVLAWFEVTNSGVETFLSWFVLPLLVLVVITCWVMVVALCFGSAITTDVCTAGPSPGSPDATVRALLDLQNYSQDEDLRQYVIQYTSGCPGEDPTQQLVDLKKLADDTIKEINEYISSIDIIGRDELKQRCGGQGIDQLAGGLSGLVVEIGVMSDLLLETEQEIKCPSIHPLYQQAVQKGICTEIATANAAGFVLFLLMSIGLMVLISLRSSWRQTVYGD